METFRKIYKTGREKDGFTSQGAPDVVPVFINQPPRTAAIYMHYTSNGQAHSCQHILGPRHSDSRISREARFKQQEAYFCDLE